VTGWGLAYWAALPCATWLAVGTAAPRHGCRCWGSGQWPPDLRGQEPQGVHSRHRVTSAAIIARVLRHGQKNPRHRRRVAPAGSISIRCHRLASIDNHAAASLRTGDTGRGPADRGKPRGSLSGASRLGPLAGAAHGGAGQHISRGEVIDDRQHWPTRGHMLGCVAPISTYYGGAAGNRCAAGGRCRTC